MTRSALALVLVLGLAPALEGAVNDPIIVAQMPWTDAAGYTPVVVECTSLSPRTIAFEVSLGSTSARLVTAVPTGTSRHTLLLPPHPALGASWAELEWRSDDDRNGKAGVPARADGDDVLVLVDPGRRIDEAGLEQAVSTWSVRQGYGSSGSYERLDVELLPDRWQAYPQDLVLLLHASAVERLGEAQRQALDAWARSGGLLVLAEGEPQTLGLPAARVLGAPWDAWARQLEAERARRRNHQVERVPVPGTAEVPAGAFALMAVLFALVVGPVNVWWAVRRRQRWLLLVTTPIISAATCVVLVAVNLASEGITTRRVVEQLVWLDGSSHQAVAWTGVTAFSPFAGTSVGLAPAVKVTFLEPEEERGFRFRRRRPAAQPRELAIDWTGGQQLGGTWLPPRVNRRLLYTEPRALRQRLLLRAEGDALILSNGLESGIELIVYIDHAGRRWQGRSIAPGSELALSAELAYAAKPGFELVEAGPVAAGRLDAAARPGHFRARLEAPLLPIPGFDGRDSLPPSGLVCGPLAVEGRR